MSQEFDDGTHSGLNPPNSYGVWGDSHAGNGVVGTSGQTEGVIGIGSPGVAGTGGPAGNGIGVTGTGSIGVWAQGDAVGVFAHGGRGPGGSGVEASGGAGVIARGVGEDDAPGGFGVQASGRIGVEATGADKLADSIGLHASGNQFGIFVEANDPGVPLWILPSASRHHPLDPPPLPNLPGSFFVADNATLFYCGPNGWREVHLL